MSNEGNPMRHAVYAVALLAGVSPAALAQEANAPTAAPAKSEVVIVTASPIAGDPERFATIVENVTRDDILAKGGDNLADALKDVPGVASTSFAAGASRPVIRGMDANRVKVLEDGVNASDVSDIGPDHGVPIDPLSAQSIEVVRGAGTLRYGSQAIGGVVNAINNRVPLDLPTKVLKGEAGATYSSVSHSTDGSLMLDGAAGQFAWHADGFARNSGDYDTPDGRQENSFFRGDGYSAGGSYFFNDDKSRTGLSVTHYDAKYGVPSDTTYIDMEQTKLMSKSSFDFGDGFFRKLNLDIGYADYQHSEDNPDGSIISTFLNKEWDSRAELLMGPLGPLSSSAVGVQYGNRKFSAIGEDSSYLFPTLTETLAGFVFTEAPLGDKLNLQAAARVDHVSIEGTPASDIFTTRDFNPVSGSVGVLYDATDAVKLGLTLSSAGRAPAVTELFARGGHDGPQTFETGDPGLHIERSTSLEGTMRVRVANVKFDGSVWGSHFQNYIYGRLTGRTCDDDGVCVAGDSEELKELFYDQADANFYGAEGKVTADVWKTTSGALEVKGLADYVRAKFTDNLGNVPRIQPWRAGGGLGWTSDAIDASFLLLYVGRQDDLGAEETPTKGYVSLDAHLDWRPLASNKGLTLILAGHNLTDAVQRNAVSLNKDDVILPGRDVSFTVRQSF
jgi:iron complex outermembrane receptor protein